MKFTETRLAGCFEIEQERRGDDRGFFARVFCVDEFASHGLSTEFVQANAAASRDRGTLRGLHLQEGDDAEDKLVRCTRGRVFDVAVDVRPGSATRGEWVGVNLSAEAGNMLYVPKGFAHGYLTLDDHTEMHYLVSAAYAPAAERGYRWDDTAFAIDWPITEGLVLSDKDRQWADYTP
ncbi:MAG: dTDP-4-dehydrorhamnose 3,5-epimerase [Pseudomonadota bacterium]